MKKIALTIFTVALVFVFAACGSKKENKEEAKTCPAQTEEVVIIEDVIVEDEIVEDGVEEVIIEEEVVEVAE